MPTTPNLAISHIDASQNQKEVTANTAFDDLDLAMTDMLGISIAGNIDITAAAAVIYEAFLDLTGAQSASTNFVLPASKKFYVIRHSATGGFTSTIKSAAVGTNGTVTLQNGDVAYVYCDATNIILVALAQRASIAATANKTLFPVSGKQNVMCDATSAAFTVTMPDATKCNGATIVVKKTDSTAHLVTVAGASQNIDQNGTFTGLYAQYNSVELYSNGTQWEIISFTQRGAVAVSGTASLSIAPGAQSVTADATGAAFTVTLPDATKCSGATIAIVKKDSSANLVTVAGFSAQNINGANTYTGLSAQYKFVEVFSDGTQWWIIGSN